MLKQGETMNILKDNKFDCFSIIENVPLDKYLQLVSHAYEHNGGISGQRGALSTKSAKQIRDQMVEDFQKGAVLPPVVLGLIDDECNPFAENFNFNLYLNQIDADKLAIIDGMQRTTAMFEADIENKADRDVRVEFWIVKTLDTLIYRMLVLNTGQIPWNIRRQLEVVYEPMKRALMDASRDLQLIEVDDSERRKSSGQFQADKIIELFLIFGSRTEKVDMKQALADNYQKLNLIESASKERVFDMFTDVLKRVVEFDMQIGRYIGQQDDPLSIKTRFRDGKDLFTSHPVLVGLITTIAQKVFGRPGINYHEERINTNFENILQHFDEMNTRLVGLDETGLEMFLDLEKLSEIVSKLKGSKVGDVEREYFKDAFKVLVDENFSLETLSICWEV